MKSFSAKKAPSFSPDDQPLPVLIHRQDNGQIVSFNKAAKKLFGLKGKSINIKRVRPNALISKSQKSNAFADLGSIRHQTLNGKSLSLQVQRKPFVWNNHTCWADFLQPDPENHSIKHQIVESLHDAFISINEKQLVCDWNPAAEKIFGWRKTEAIGKKMANLIVPVEFRKNLVHRLNRYVKTDESKTPNQHFEINAWHKKGHQFPAELTITTVLENDRIMIYAFVRDITERKKMEQSFRDSEEKLKRTQTIASIGSWEMYGNFNELHWSDEFYRIHGLQPGSVTPSTKLRLAMTHIQDREKLQTAISEAVRQGKPYSLEKRIIKPNGETRWVLSQGEATLDIKTGKRKVFGTLLDITERKLATEALNSLNASLSETLIFGKMGSAELDLKTLTLCVSKELLHLLDVEVPDAQPMLLKDFLNRYIHPKYLSLVHQKVEEGMSSNTQSKTVVEAEFQMITAKNREIWIEAKGIFKSGTALGILQDVTARKKTLEELAQKNATIQNMLNGITDGVFAVDRNLNFTLVSPAFAKLANMLVDDMVGKNMLVHFPFMEGGKLLAAYRNAIQAQKATSFEFRNTVNPEQVFEINIYPNPEGLFIYYKDVSDRVVAENDLVALLNATDDSTFFLNRKGQIRIANSAAEAHILKLFGKKFEKGKLIEDYFPPEAVPNFQESFKQALHGSTVQYERQWFQPILQKDFWFAITYLPVRDDSGTIIGVSLTTADVTEKKTASIALSESHRLLNRLSANVPGMIYNFYLNRNGAGVFEYVSEGAANLFEITATDLMRDANQLFSRIHPDDVLRVMDSIKQAFHKQQNWSAEFRVVLAGGVEKWVSAASKLYQETDDRNLWYGFMQDITEIKRVHQQISNVTDTIPDGFIYEFWQSRDGSDYKINYISQGCERLFEVKLEDALNKADSLFSLIHPDDITPFFKLVEEKRKRPGKFDVDYRVVMPDGRMKWVNGRANVRLLSDHSTVIEGIALDVTHQKTLEQDEREAKAQLSQSENHLRAILNASTDFTVFLDTNCRVLVANAQAHRGIKWLVEHDMKIGDAFDALMPESIRARFRTNFERALAGEVIDSDREVELLTRETLWLQLRYLPVKNDLGTIMGVSFNVTNITARKQAELALRESEERFKNLYNRTPAMLHSIDQAGKLIRVSDYWLQKMGYTRQEVIGRSSVDFLTEDSRKKAMEVMIPKFFTDGYLKNVEYDFVTKDGRILNTLLSASSENDGAGKLIKSLAVITDITEKKKLEHEVQKLALIASRTSNAVILTDVEGRITWVNEGFERITEFTRNEAIGKRPQDFLQGPETSSATLGYMHKQQQLGKHFKGELLNYTKSGKAFWLDIEVMPVHDEANHLTGFMAIESDITPMKFAISEMLNSQTRLQTMMNNAPMIVFMKDLKGRYTFYNYAYQKSRSHTHLQSGHRDADLFDADTATFLKQKDEQVMNMMLPVSFEHQLNGRQYYTIIFPILNQHDTMYALGGISVDITERKQADEALRQSEANLKSVFENSDIAFALLDNKFNIVSMNSLGFRLLRNVFQKDIVVGESAMNYVSAGRREFVQKFLMDTLAGKPNHYETRFPVNHEMLWFELRFFPVFNNQAVTGIIFALTDITARKASEAEITQNRERLKLISDNLPSVAIYQYEVPAGGWHGQYKYYSVGVEQITGISSDALMQDAELFEKEIHPDDWLEKQRLLKISIDTVTVFNQDYRFRHRNGQWKWLRTRSQPTHLDDGRMIWNGLIIDITDQKHSENEIARSEARLRSIIQTEPNCVKILNDRGELMEMNTAGLKMIEADNLNQVAGHPVVEIVDEAFRAQFKKLTTAVINGETGLLQFSITGLRGAKRWLETRAVPLADPDTQKNLLLGITRDITAEKEAQEKLLASLREKELLIKEIHHRVKNNLQLISSILYIRMAGMQHSDIKMFLQETRQKIHSIALIHERLLQTESVNQVDIADYLNKLMLDLQMSTLSHERKIDLQANIESANMSLDMAINCGLILNELITNATKHAFPNNATGSIFVSLKKVDEKFEFIVQDNGCGMPTNINLGSGGFGMQVLDVFIKQLKATVQLSRSNGTRFKLIF